MSSLASIQTQFAAYDPATVEQTEIKAALAVYINAVGQRIYQWTSRRSSAFPPLFGKSSFWCDDSTPSPPQLSSVERNGLHLEHREPPDHVLTHHDAVRITVRLWYCFDFAAQRTTINIGRSVYWQCSEQYYSRILVQAL
jgi:hypothetical protein